jgi:tetratricopeptide (TPR) repeat protein/predicted Ser/Thr protein kinase
MHELEREHRIRRLVGRALEMPPGERAAFLEGACAGDASLRRGVESALRAHDAATMVDGAGATAPVNGSAGDAHERGRGLRAKSEQAAAEAKGARRFGQYRLLRTLGEGGMGLVYLAEQDRTGQLVALKLVRPGLATERLLSRFEQEVRTLGLLRHPGIARIYDAGAEDAGFGPQPYFAMEYIEGRPLTEHAEATGLDLQARLALLVEVCHAVHHAHTKGVIHRDIKPSNILVDGAGCAKVLDFGVARAVEPDAGASMRTEAGQLVGTLPYMSPEQLGGDPADLDTRSDVYALGVVMYELLSGSLPHDLTSSSLVDAVRIVSERDPTPLLMRNQALPADVRTICFKALERDRERRYQSASDLARDIERFLADEPISARAPSTMYLLRKFARRNQTLVAGAAAVLIALGAGFVGTAYMAVRATIQRDRAVSAEAAAEAARRIAEEDAATAKSITGFLTSMLASADPETALGRELTVRDALDTSAVTIENAFESQPMVEAEVRLTLGSVYSGLGEIDRAEPHLIRARDLLLERQGPDSRDTLNANRFIGNMHAEKGEFELAEPMLAGAIERLRTQFGPNDPDVISAERDLARVLAETGRMEEAEGSYRELLERCRRVLGPDNEQTLVALHNLASCVKDQGRLQEALGLMRESLEARRRVYGPDHPQTLYSLNSLAAILSRLGESAEAEALFRETVAGREKMLGPDHPSTALARQNLANQLIMQGRASEAEPEVQRVLEIFTNSLGPSHPRTIVAINALGYLQEDLGNLEEAEELYRRALELTRGAHGMNHPETFAPLNNLATLVQRRGRPEEASVMFDELVSTAAKSLPDTHFFLAIFRNNQGDCLREMGKFDGAEALLLASRESMVNSLGEGHARVTKATQRLVTLYEAKGDAEQAAKWRGALPQPAE